MAGSGDAEDLKYVRLQVPVRIHRELRILAARSEMSIAMYTRELVAEVVKNRLSKTHLTNGEK